MKAKANTTVYFREKTPQGKVIAKVDVVVVMERGQFRRDMSGQWLTLATPLEYVPAGVSDIVVTCEGEGVDIDWIQIKNRQKYFTPTASNAAPARPDDNGFIRRWMLLEPIKQDIRSNTVFTDTWLRDVFSKNYFKNQMTMMPKDGQKVKVGTQTLAWHALDSENYNVKLFRFAEKWGDQTYGSLFWTVTTIDCPEGLENVRLAAGSNGASIWWIDGEEVLMLSGDRRMVEDDGMSRRLTLAPGRHVIRGSVVNGPGLSDFCIRFIDDKGNPVTDKYSVITQQK